MAELQTALALIASHPERSRFVGPRSEALVDAAEGALGLILPPTYREFVLKLGAGNVGSFEVFGVVSADFRNSGIPDAIWLTLRAREEWPLPASMVAVYFDGATGYFVLDTSRRDAEAESPVLRWYPGLSSPATAQQVVAPDFGSFLLKTVESALAEPGELRRH
ncbi:MAG TPA: SMI1/KNR4 family protein [Candidatus Limnocylindria bacterium]|jgi:hypothetical protein|nr:SMI1/KNR4 family protein [Candidatus Limnocylindria bacterium]